jgi:hypothetical protein
MAIDISKLFSDIAGPANTDLVEGTARLNAMDTPGGMAALLSPQRSRAMRQGLGGLFGNPAGGMTPQEQVPEAMRGLDINDPNSIAQVIRKLNAIGATKEASQLKLGLDQLIAENANTAAELLVKQDTVKVRNREAASSEAQVLVNETNAATQSGQLAQDIIEHGQDVIEFDEDVRQDNLDRLTPGMSDISLSNATPKSVQEYLAANRAAGNDPKARDAAWALLRKTPKQDWEYRKDGELKDDNGNQAWYLYPVGAELERIENKRATRVTAGHQQRRSAANVVGTMGRMIEKVEAGDIATGISGLFWKEIPGTEEFSFQGDLSVVLGNLGYEGLMSAKSSSESGASGFGQLTEKELLLLQSLDADLASGVGMDRSHSNIGTTQPKQTGQSMKLLVGFLHSSLIRLLVQLLAPPQIKTFLTSTYKG